MDQASSTTDRNGVYQSTAPQNPQTTRMGSTAVSRTGWLLHLRKEVLIAVRRVGKRAATWFVDNVPALCARHKERSCLLLCSQLPR